MSNITQLSDSVKKAIKEASDQVKKLDEQITQLYDDKRRYVLAPNSRDVVLSMIKENIDRVADNFAELKVNRYLHDCAIHEARSEQNRGVIMPALDSLLVDGVVGNPGSWKIRSDALVWLLRDVMTARLEENIKEMNWPQGFDDGFNKKERDAAIIDIDKKLSELTTQKQSILDEIESAGGKLIT